VLARGREMDAARGLDEVLAVGGRAPGAAANAVQSVAEPEEERLLAGLDGLRQGLIGGHAGRNCDGLHQSGNPWPEGPGNLRHCGLRLLDHVMEHGCRDDLRVRFAVAKNVLRHGKDVVDHQRTVAAALSGV